MVELVLKALRKSKTDHPTNTVIDENFPSLLSAACNNTKEREEEENKTVMTQGPLNIKKNISSKPNRSRNDIISSRNIGSGLSSSSDSSGNSCSHEKETVVEVTIVDTIATTTETSVKPIPATALKMTAAAEVTVTITRTKIIQIKISRIVIQHR